MTPSNDSGEISQVGGDGPFAAKVGRTGVVLSVVTLVTLATFAVYALIKVWPHPTVSGGPPEGAQSTPTTSAVQARPQPLACDATTVPRHVALTPPDSMRDPDCVSLFRIEFPLW